MRLLLVCNYAPDAQQSMLRFGAMLREGLAARGHEVATLAPEARWGGRRRGPAEKWLRYLDKYVAFPRQLRRRVAHEARRGPLLVHVVDHSNAVYVPHARGARDKTNSVRWLVTCHDLLAVRGALGEDTDCPASALGRRLQAAILAGLARADAVACDSTSTRRDLERLAPEAGAQLRDVILLGLNQPLRPLARSAALARLAAVGGVPWNAPFLLHVGSNLKRKNRAAIVRVLARARATWPELRAVFAGEALDDDLRRIAREAGVAGEIFGAAGLSAAQLEAAYSLAHALVFPSKCEGFGWPVIEAQACGCPVICSDRTSLPEIAGDAAALHALEDESGMAESVLRLRAAEWRAEMTARGAANLSRFEGARMFEAYLALYRRVSAAQPAARAVAIPS
jgi:glycosyltransferase involved in cell wall biosynthesis